MTVVLVTGASGFIGRALCMRLAATDLICRAAVRDAHRIPAQARDHIVVPDVGPETNWDAALRGVDAVVHLAARAHLPGQRGAAAQAAFRRVNVEGTRRLVAAATRAGVRRLVFVSSIGVNGTRTQDRPFTETDVPAPVEDYAVSKLQAERAAREEAAGGKLELVIVRPCLVYGPGNPGNMRRILRLVRSRMPLPMASVVNKRSLIGIDNLADLLLRTITSPAAAGELFLASDGEDVSTPELLRYLADGLGVPLRLWPLPETLVRMAASAVGRRREYESLWTSLRIDSSKARRVLHWRPAASVSEGLQRTGAWYRESRRAA